MIGGALVAASALIVQLELAFAAAAHRDPLSEPPRCVKACSCVSVLMGGVCVREGSPAGHGG